MSRRWRIVLILTLVSSSICGLVIYVLVDVLNGQERNYERIQTTRVIIREKVAGADSTLAKTVRRLSRAIRKLDRERREQDALIRDLRAAGAKLPSVMNGERGRPGLPGTRGRPGPAPTSEQIAAAVSEFCATHVCGLAPTQGQVLDAVRQYCGNDRCRGSEGPAGASATQGQVNAAVVAFCAAGGCAGPAPTDEQVQAAVDAYCMAHQNCSPPVVVDEAPPADGVP